MQSGKILVAQSEHTFILKLCGDVRLTFCATLDDLLKVIFQQPQINTVMVDLSEAENLDSTTLGLLAKIAIQAQVAGFNVPTIICAHTDIQRLLMSMGFEQFFVIANEPMRYASQLAEAPLLQASEQEMRAQILDAHKTLMSMNENNREAFQSVVEALEAHHQEVNTTN